MIEKEKQTNNSKSILVAAGAVTICIFGFLRIPVSGLLQPLVLQNMAVIIVAGILGSAQAGGACGLFFTAGVLGLPVFAVAQGGFSCIKGLNGGFFIGYFIAALVTGFMLKNPSQTEKTPLKKVFTACLAGYAVIYIPGIIHLTDLGLFNSEQLLPMLGADAVKLAVTIPAVYYLRPKAARFMQLD